MPKNKKLERLVVDLRKIWFNKRFDKQMATKSTWFKNYVIEMTPEWMIPGLLTLWPT